MVLYEYMKLTKDDKERYVQEVLGLIKDKVQLYGLTFSPELFQFGVDMFQEGVGFIPNQLEKEEANKKII